MMPFVWLWALNLLEQSAWKRLTRGYRSFYPHYIEGAEPRNLSGGGKLQVLDSRNRKHESSSQKTDIQRGPTPGLRDDTHVAHVKQLSARERDHSKEEPPLSTASTGQGLDLHPISSQNAWFQPRGSSLQTEEWNNLAAFFLKSPCSPSLMVGYGSQPNLAFHWGWFLANSHCWTPALTEVNGYHLATRSIGLILFGSDTAPLGIEI